MMKLKYRWFVHSNSHLLKHKSLLLSILYNQQKNLKYDIYRKYKVTSPQPSL